MTSVEDHMDKQRCTAKSKQSGERCQRYCSPGATVCFVHGGGSPKVKAAAVRRVAEAEAEAAVERWALPRDISAREALAEELARTAGYVDAYDALVQELTARGVIADGAPLPIVRLLADERRHLTDVGRAAAAAGLDEARVAQVQLQAAAINRFGRFVVATVLEVVGATLTSAQQAELGRRVAAEMRAIGESIDATAHDTTPAPTTVGA